jgi:predicted transcriptional regulator
MCIILPKEYEDLARKDEAILSHVQRTPGIRQAEISKNLGMNICTARYHLMSLACKGILRIEKTGNSVRIYPAN